GLPGARHDRRTVRDPDHRRSPHVPLPDGDRRGAFGRRLDLGRGGTAHGRPGPGDLQDPLLARRTHGPDRRAARPGLVARLLPVQRRRSMGPGRMRGVPLSSKGSLRITFTPWMVPTTASRTLAPAVPPMSAAARVAAVAA